MVAFAGVTFCLLASKAAKVPPLEIFTDITEQAGILWRHFNGESDDRLLIEASCGGVALFDFDNDGLLDIYFVNGGETPKGKSKAPVRNALYRNLGRGRFEEVGAKAGVDRIDFFGMGAAAADYDNDGYQDLFVTGYPFSALFHNNGDGTFTEVSDKARLKNVGQWAASVAWFDYDRDGYLDLFVTNYASLSWTDPKRCSYSGAPTYCAQTEYDGLTSKLYHNNGDGTFSDVSSQSGIGKHRGRAFGVVAIDIDDDGWPDLFVARDASPNLLLVNERNGTFEDVALQAEAAYSPDGTARAGMGVDAGDVDGDGRPDFVVTNFSTEYHALYLNTGAFPFEERTIPSGLAGITRPYVGWGASFLDYDNDGVLDLVIATGHLNSMVELIQKDVSYKQPPLLLANNGAGRFKDVKDTAGPTFRTPGLARGLAVGDIDNDGDPDLVIVHLNDKPVLLRNNVGQEPWIGFRLVGKSSNRDAIGARLVVHAGKSTFTRWITGGGSFLSSHDNRVLVGLGRRGDVKAVSVEIRWPNGATQKISSLPLNQYHEITEQR
jgi:hypothetical protein